MGHKNFALIAGIGGAGMLALLVGFGASWRDSGARGSTPSRLPRHSRSVEAKELAAVRPNSRAELEAQLAEQAAEKAGMDAEALMKLKLPAVATKKTEVLTKHIAAEAKRIPARWRR